MKGHSMAVRSVLQYVALRTIDNDLADDEQSDHWHRLYYGNSLLCKRESFILFVALSGLSHEVQHVRIPTTVAFSRALAAAESQATNCN